MERTFPGCGRADCDPPVGEAVVDEDATAERRKCERQPQQRGAQRDVYCQVPPVRGSLPEHFLIPEVVRLRSPRLRLCMCARSSLSHG